MKYEITKGSEKDFDGAPEWATLRTFTGGCYFFVEEHRIGARVFSIASKNEFKVENSFDEKSIDIIAQRRPITEPVVNQQLTTEWDGEGLPPAGTKCECDSAGDWQECTVILSVDNAIVWQWDWQRPNNACISYAHCAPKFRPIRSPEDVARDEAIKAMREALGHAAGLIEVRNIYDAIAAGKIPGVKLE